MASAPENRPPTSARGGKAKGAPAKPAAPQPRPAPKMDLKPLGMRVGIPIVIVWVVAAFVRHWIAFAVAGVLTALVAWVGSRGAANMNWGITGEAPAALPFATLSGVAIGFWDYFRVGAPLTVITLAIGTLWLWL